MGGGGRIGEGLGFNVVSISDDILEDSTNWGTAMITYARSAATSSQCSAAGSHLQEQAREFCKNFTLNKSVVFLTQSALSLFKYLKQSRLLTFGVLSVKELLFTSCILCLSQIRIQV